MVGALYVYRAPLVVEVNARLAAVPLQMVCTRPELTMGFGLTVITTATGNPVHPPTPAGAVGVTMYVAVCT